MAKFPTKCVVDTNVPITANKVRDLNDITDLSLIECIENCVEAIRQVSNNKSFVMDEGNEIYDEYRHKLNLQGQPGVGDMFLKLVHDFRWQLPQDYRVKITKQGDSYKEFPMHEGLKDFDLSDRKFVAVANAHPQKPPILQATDSKWWGWKDALKEKGINVEFLCPDYCREKYLKKFNE